MNKSNFVGMQKIKSETSSSNPEVSTNEDFAYIHSKHAKDAENKKQPWSERHPKLSKVTDSFMAAFFFLALIGGGIICIAGATTILVEGTKALFRIIGSFFGW